MSQAEISSYLFISIERFEVLLSPTR